jgi:hypothetical protein
MINYLSFLRVSKIDNATRFPSAFSFASPLLNPAAKEWHPPLFPLSAAQLISLSPCHILHFPTKKLPAGFLWEKDFFRNLEPARAFIAQLLFSHRSSRKSEFARRKIKQCRFWLVISQTEKAVFLARVYISSLCTTEFFSFPRKFYLILFSLHSIYFSQRLNGKFN